MQIRGRPIRIRGSGAREARLRLRLTQFALARRVGCSESQIAKIETGRANPPLWLKEAVAKEADALADALSGAKVEDEEKKDE